MIGKSEQLTTTGAQLFDEKKLLDINNPNYDKSQAGSGVIYYKFKTNEQVTVSVSKKNHEGEYLSVCVEDNHSDQTWLSHATASSTTFRTLTPKNGYIYLGVNNTMDMIKKMLKKTGGIMINRGTSVKTYEPYTGGKVSPSPDYPQGIKSVGKWNEVNQKYEVDVKVTNAKESWDKEQTLTLTSDRPITKWDKLVEQDGQIGWLYNSEIDNDVKPSRLDLFPHNFNLYKNHENGVYTYRVTNIKKRVGFQTSLCKQFKNEDGSYNTGKLFNYSDHPSLEMQYFSTNIPTAEEFRQWMENNPLTMIYQTKTSEFVPIPKEEQDAIRALRTYYPTTVITVDGGEVDPDVEVTYIADTKNYIDQKIAAIRKTVVETQKALL